MEIFKGAGANGNNKAHGYKYKYGEGKMNFPDPLDKPSGL